MLSEPMIMTSGAAAFLVGMLTSPHCLLMCGPLSCGLLGGPKYSAEQTLLARTLYHLSRVLAYAIVGTVAGTLGYAFTETTAWNLQPFLPWVLVAILVAFAFRIHARLPKPPCVTRIAHRITLRTQTWPVALQGTALGLVTPMLPCGPLYSVFWIAMMASSPLLGAELGLGFGLGTIPLLWLGQHAFTRLRAKFSGAWVGRIQRGVAGLAALAISLKMLDFDAQRIMELCGF